MKRYVGIDSTYVFSRMESKIRSTGIFSRLQIEVISPCLRSLYIRHRLLYNTRLLTCYIFFLLSKNELNYLQVYHTDKIVRKIVIVSIKDSVFLFNQSLTKVL